MGKHFQDSEDVFISCGDIFGIDGSFDGIISPANSHSRMDGGIDYHYSRFFGWDLQDRLQREISIKYSGLLPVGDNCIAIETFNQKISYLLSCPTMVIPQDVSDTKNAYKAFLAGLKEAKKLHLKSILCPGLGTLTGRIPFDECAKQM